MKKFILIYHSTPESLVNMANLTPEQKAAGMQPWMEWKAKHEEHVVDFGTPLMGGMKVGADGSANPSTKQVSGFSIIQAADMDAARSILGDHPHNAAERGHEIEVHEYAPM